MSRKSLFRSACVLMSACAWASAVAAQEPGQNGEQVDRAAKPEKTATAPAGLGSRISQLFSWAEARMENQSAAPKDGFFPEMSGLIPGSGLSIGPGYRQHVFGDHAVVNTSAAISWNRYSMVQSQITWPALLNDKLSVGAQVKYQDFTQINYFGIGGQTLEDQRTNYRLKDVDVLGTATVRPNAWLSITGRTGVLRRVDIESGTSNTYSSIETQFDEASAPGLSRQPDYVHGDLTLTATTLDAPAYPSRGGRYRLQIGAFHDQDFGSYSFRRIEAEAWRFVPIRRSALGFRARLNVTQTGDGQQVPFYLLPSLGGTQSLRGFSDYRFRDRDSLLLNAEYRWPIWRAVDAAVFYDTGSVAPSVNGLTSQLHHDYGAGVRLHSATHLMVRMDVARSREGLHAIFSLTTPLSLPKGTVIPYAP